MNWNLIYGQKSFKKTFSEVEVFESHQSQTDSAQEDKSLLLMTKKVSQSVESIKRIRNTGVLHICESKKEKNRKAIEIQDSSFEPKVPVPVLFRQSKLSCSDRNYIRMEEIRNSK